MLSATLASGRMPVTSEVKSMDVPRVEVIVKVSVVSSVVTVIPEPLAKVKVSVLVSATTSDWPETAKVLKMFWAEPKSELAMVMDPAPLVMVIPVPWVRVAKAGAPEPSPMSSCPLVRTPVSERVAPPRRMPPAVKEVAPVPPLPTATVPLTLAAFPEISPETLVPAMEVIQAGSA